MSNRQKLKRPIDDYVPDIRLVDDRGMTPERSRQAGGAFATGDNGVVTVRQHTIDRAVARGTLTAKQGDAALKLYSHWWRAGMAGSIGSSDLNKVFGTGSGGLYASESREFNADRLRAGLDEIRAAPCFDARDAATAVKVTSLIVFEDLTFRDAGYAVGYESGDAAQKAAIMYTRLSLNILIHLWGL